MCSVVCVLSCCFWQVILLWFSVFWLIYCLFVDIFSWILCKVFGKNSSTWSWNHLLVSDVAIGYGPEVCIDTDLNTELYFNYQINGEAFKKRTRIPINKYSKGKSHWWCVTRRIGTNFKCPKCLCSSFNNKPKTNVIQDKKNVDSQEIQKLTPE